MEFKWEQSGNDFKNIIFRIMKPRCTIMENTLGLREGWLGGVHARILHGKIIGLGKISPPGFLHFTHGYTQTHKTRGIPKHSGTHQKWVSVSKTNVNS